MTRGLKVWIGVACIPVVLSGYSAGAFSEWQREAVNEHATPAASIQEPDTVTRVLDFDGLTVIHRYRPESEVVAAELYLLGGSRQISDSTAGIEPLLLRASEHGTKNYPGRAAREALARTGGWAFIGPDIDWTVFGMRSVAEAFDSTWAVFADRLMHPTLDSAAVETERAKMVAAAKARLSDPDERVRALVRTAAMADHPYGREFRGTEHSLTRLRITELEAYLAEQIVKSRMLLVVVGGVDSARLRDAVDRTIAELPVGDYNWELPETWSAEDPSVTVAYESIPTKYIFGYFAGPQASADDHGAFRFALIALTSIISQRVSEEGLTYSGGALFFDRGASLGAIHFSTDFPKDCIEIANEAIDELSTSVYRRSALRRYGRGTEIDYYVYNETSGEQAATLARTYLFNGELASPQQHVDAIVFTSPTAVKNAARKYFKNIQYGFLGDTSAVPRREMTEH